MSVVGIVSRVTPVHTRDEGGPIASEAYDPLRNSMLDRTSDRISLTTAAWVA